MMSREDIFIKELDEVTESMDACNRKALDLRKKILDLLDQNPGMDHQSWMTSTLINYLGESLDMNVELSKTFIKFMVAVKNLLGK